MIVSTTFGKHPQHRPRFDMTLYTVPGTMRRQQSSSKSSMTTASISFSVITLQLQTNIYELLHVLQRDVMYRTHKMDGFILNECGRTFNVTNFFSRQYF